MIAAILPVDADKFWFIRIPSRSLYDNHSQLIVHVLEVDFKFSQTLITIHIFGQCIISCRHKKTGMLLIFKGLPVFVKAVNQPKRPIIYSWVI
ncbi:hypothetical protein D3C75_813880 [compost metagenome]